MRLEVVKLPLAKHGFRFTVGGRTHFCLDSLLLSAGLHL